MLEKKVFIIIDGDTPVYRASGAVKEHEPVSHALNNAKVFMRKLFDYFGHKDHVMYLTSTKDFHWRYEIFPEYKANRDRSKRPKYYNEVRQYFIDNYNTVVVEGMEADDAVSIKQYQYLYTNPMDKDITCESIIVGVDKDLNQIPGWHYNFIKNRKYFINQELSLQSFYLQMLEGDRADNIPRIEKGWKVKNFKHQLENLKTQEQMAQLVFNTIKDVKFKGISNPEIDIKKEMTWRGRLLWLKRFPEDMYDVENDLC